MVEAAVICGIVVAFVLALAGIEVACERIARWLLCERQRPLAQDLKDYL